MGLDVFFARKILRLIAITDPRCTMDATGISLDKERTSETGSSREANGYRMFTPTRNQPETLTAVINTPLVLSNAIPTPEPPTPPIRL